MTCCCCYCCWVASVVSNSVRPHRRQPTRLCCPWDSPGKNTGVGCHLFRMWDSVMWGTFTVLGNNRYHPVILKITATSTTQLFPIQQPRHLATTLSLQLFPLGYFYISASFLKISSLFIFVILSITSLGLFYSWFLLLFEPAYNGCFEGFSVNYHIWGYSETVHTDWFLSLHISFFCCCWKLDILENIS